MNLENQADTAMVICSDPVCTEDIISGIVPSCESG